MPKQRHEKFDNVVLFSGFRLNECDKRVYVNDTDEGYVILCLYVDVMIIVGSNDKVIWSTNNMLNSKFDMKNMGLVDVILCVKITKTYRISLFFKRERVLSSLIYLVIKIWIQPFR